MTAGAGGTTATQMPFALSPEELMTTRGVQVKPDESETVMVWMPAAPVEFGATIATSSEPGGGEKLPVVTVSAAVV
jgi:hypothetical protein